MTTVEEELIVHIWRKHAWFLAWLQTESVETKNLRTCESVTLNEKKAIWMDVPRTYFFESLFSPLERPCLKAWYFRALGFSDGEILWTVFNRPSSSPPSPGQMRSVTCSKKNLYTRSLCSQYLLCIVSPPPPHLSVHWQCVCNVIFWNKIWFQYLGEERCGWTERVPLFCSIGGAFRK